MIMGDKVTLDSVQMNVYKDCKILECCKLIAIDNINLLESFISGLLNVLLFIFGLLAIFLWLYPHTKPFEFYVYIIVAVIYFILQVANKVFCNGERVVLEDRYNSIKKEIASIYYTQLDDYDKMDQWVKDKVFKESILPYTGVQTPETE